MHESREKALAYGSNVFAYSFEEIGEVITLPVSGIHLIKRPIKDGLFDLIGVYPFVMSSNWYRLKEDDAYINSLRAVSLVFVTNPFEEKAAYKALKDWSYLRKYKKHYNIHLLDNWQNKLDGETRRLIRKTSETHSILEVEPSQYWVEKFWILYQNLIKRHDISDINQVTLSMLKKQLKVSGTYMTAGVHQGKVRSMMILFIKDEYAYLYLHASDDMAYKLNTNYVLYFKTYEMLRNKGVKWIHLGGNAGSLNNDNDGLSRFKKKWANDERYSLLCGKILNKTVYNKLSKELCRSGDFFPAYR